MTQSNTEPYEPLDPTRMIKELHEAFHHPHNTTPIENPLRSEYAELRFNLIDEEFLELKEAYLANDPVKYFDALLDLIVVIYGDTLTKGWDAARGLRIVHNSNLTKLGEDRQPIYREDGKFLKGPNFIPPEAELESLITP